MIKGFGSGKLLKLLSSILLIGFFGLGVNSFASASNGYYVRQIGNYGYNPFIQSQDIAVINNGTVLTQLAGYTKRVIWLGTDSAFFWNNGNPAFLWNRDDYYSYTHHYYHKAGIFTKFSVCDELDGSDISTLSNCTSYEFNSNSRVLIGNFLNHVSNSDYFVVMSTCGGTQCIYKYRGFGISSSELGSTIYFGYSSNGSSIDDSIISQTSGNLDFSSIPESLLGYPPSSNNSGNGDSGSQNVDINNNISGDYVYSNCTYKQIFDYLESFGYNDYVCFGGLDNFDLYDSTTTYNPIPLSGKTLGQILSYSNAWDTPNDWFIFWNGLYIDRYNSNYNAMRESYPAVYRTWFDLYYRYGGSSLIFDTVREYCAMKQLDINFNTTTYKGQYFKNTCSSIQNGSQWGYDVGSQSGSGSGDVENAVGVNWIGIGDVGSQSGSKVSNDPSVFIQDFFNELKANLPTRYDLGGGFLPIYIITFLCALILFRFLSH